MDIEGFTGPAGSDGLGVRMLEAVHRSQLITFRMPLAAQREGEVQGQILIIHPLVTRPSIWFAEHPLVGIAGDGDPALMHRGVVPLAEQNQVVEVGAAAQNPRHYMMSL